jgi:hypothetical protein
MKDNTYVITLLCIIFAATVGGTFVIVHVFLAIESEKWEKEKTVIDSKSCGDLGKMLLETSQNTNNDFISIKEYKYIDAKLRLGDCNK